MSMNNIRITFYANQLDLYAALLGDAVRTPIVKDMLADIDRARDRLEVSEKGRVRIDFTPDMLAEYERLLSQASPRSETEEILLPGMRRALESARTRAAGVRSSVSVFQAPQKRAGLSLSKPEAEYLQALLGQDLARLNELIQTAKPGPEKEAILERLICCQDVLCRLIAACRKLSEEA